MRTGTKQKNAFRPRAEESLGREEILSVSIFRPPDGFLFWWMLAPGSLCWSVLPFELALAVQWLCGATTQPWPGSGAFESTFALSHGFLAVSCRSDGGPACGEKLCGERAAVPDVHSGGAHGTRELGIQ